MNFISSATPSFLDKNNPVQNIERLSGLTSNQMVTTWDQNCWDCQVNGGAYRFLSDMSATAGGAWSTLKWGTITAAAISILKGNSFGFGPTNEMCASITHILGDRSDIFTTVWARFVRHLQCLEHPLYFRPFAITANIIETFLEHPTFIAVSAIGIALISYNMAIAKNERKRDHADDKLNYTLYHDYHQMSKALVDSYKHACTGGNESEKQRLEQIAIKLRSQLNNIRDRFSNYTHISKNNINILISLLEDGINNVLAVRQA